MDYQPLFGELEKHANPFIALQMSAYMRNLFPFLGIKAPQLNALCKPFLKKYATNNPVDWDFVFTCWQKPYREAQYVAVRYLENVAPRLKANDMSSLGELIVTKSWWDTVDALSKVVGVLVMRYPQHAATMIEWSCNDNIWIRRVAILHQLMYKEKTDTVILEQILTNNWGTNEFFIDKAIGWILRQYSKTNPDWVRRFIFEHKTKMSKLTIREGSKYI